MPARVAVPGEMVLEVREVARSGVSGSAVLEVRGARHRFGATVALDGVDLRVDAGECVALLGPNGAGKTTLVGQDTGLPGSGAGTIRVVGHDSPAVSNSGSNWRWRWSGTRRCWCWTSPRSASTSRPAGRSGARSNAAGTVGRACC